MLNKKSFRKEIVNSPYLCGRKSMLLKQRPPEDKFECCCIIGVSCELEYEEAEREARKRMRELLGKPHKIVLYPCSIPSYQFHRGDSQDCTFISSTASLFRFRKGYSSYSFVNKHIFSFHVIGKEVSPQKYPLEYYSMAFC